MPTIEPKLASDPYDDGDPLTLCRDVYRHLANWARPEYPARPDGLPDNGRLADIVHRKHTGRGVLGEDRATLALFGAWSFAVYRAEGEAVARLLVLLGCIRRLDETDPTMTKAAPFRRFIRGSYGRWPPRYVGHAVVEKVAHALATDVQLLPSYLRHGERAPEHVRAAAPKVGTYKHMSEEDAYDE